MTPTITPTNTETPTETPTPTPTPTQQTLEIEIITQDGFFIITQDNNPLILQQLVQTYSISNGLASCALGAYSLTGTVYSSSVAWDQVVRFYSDQQMTTPFNGGNLWYSNTTDGCGGLLNVDNNGFTNNSYCGGLC